MTDISTTTEIQPAPDFNPVADVWLSTEYAFAAIRERMATGGPGWRVPSICTCRCCQREATP